MNKKLFKSIVSLSCCVALASTIPFAVTSCSKKAPNRQIDDSHFEYINQRTLSIGAWFSNTGIYGGVTFGTMWFYKRVSDYKYVFITNYHVYRGIYEAATDYPYHHALMIACAPYNSGKQQNMSSQDYCFFDDQYNISDLKACYEYVGLIKYEGEVKETYMDMTAIELDLTDVYKDSNTPKNIKDKLDYINSQAKVGENVVTICDDVNKGDKVYIAGYPWTTSDNEERDYTYFTEWYDNIYKEETRINSISGLEYFTFQHQFFLPCYKHIPLGGGASGSMVVNEKNEVVGIYWGGGYNKSNEFYPSFATFELANEQLEKTFNFFADVDSRAW